MVIETKESQGICSQFHRVPKGHSIQFILKAQHNIEKKKNMKANDLISCPGFNDLLTIKGNLLITK